MNAPLMPKATAVWLVDNTALTFDQIAEFCGLHALEVQAIADEEVAIGMQGLDPIANGQLTREEISRCETDSALRLDMASNDIPVPEARSKGPRYTPLSKRQDKPDAVAWLLRHYPELSDAQVGRLIGTTKPTINSIRDRSHWNSPNLRPRSPVEIGLCTMDELESNLETARARAQRKADRERKALEKAARERGEELPPLEPAPVEEAPAEPAAAPETPSWTSVTTPEPDKSRGKQEWPTLPGEQDGAAAKEEEAEEETPAWPTLPSEESDDEQKESQ